MNTVTTSTAVPSGGTGFSMSPEVMIVVAVIGLVIFAYVLRFIIRKVFNKAGDVIQNKLADKKNEKSAGKEENLSDRYK